MRRAVKKRNKTQPDHQYGSLKVGKLINYVMQGGKKSTAEAIVYNAFQEIEKKEKGKNAQEVFEGALTNVGPTLEVRSRRVGGANYQVPYEVRPERKLALALRWIVDSSRGKKGKPMHRKLAEELIAANKGEGEAVKKRENTHRMAEANKAFAHFAWSGKKKK